MKLPSRRAGTATANATPTAPASPASTTGTASAASGSPPKLTPGGSPLRPGQSRTVPGTGDVENEARFAFSGIDDNKDGELVETEWANHQRTRQMFETAGTKVPLPIKVDAFIGLYRTAKAAGSRG